MAFNGSIYHPALTTEDYHPRVVAYYYKQWDGFDMSFHRHVAVEIMYVISGSCVVETEDAGIEMRKGEFILLDSNVPHRLIVAPGKPCRILNVEYVFVRNLRDYISIRELSEGSPELRRFLARQDPYYVHKDPSDIYQILRSLVVELDDQLRESEWTVQLLLAQLMLRLARLLGCDGERREKQQSAYVQKALDYMHQHYDRGIKVEDVAAAVNLHPNYLHRIFKQHTGRTLMQYLMDFRMEKARMLLTNTNIPISDIADYIGLGSRQYFSALFRRYSGQTPVAYRKSAESWVRE